MRSVDGSAQRHTAMVVALQSAVTEFVMNIGRTFGSDPMMDSMYVLLCSLLFILIMSHASRKIIAAGHCVPVVLSLRMGAKGWPLVLPEHRVTLNVIGWRHRGETAEARRELLGLTNAFDFLLRLLCNDPTALVVDLHRRLQRCRIVPEIRMT